MITASENGGDRGSGRLRIVEPGRALLLVALTLVLALATPAFAGKCSWVTPPTVVAFGNYSVFAPGAVTTSTQFRFRCNPNTYARLALSRGSSGTYLPSRTMAGPDTALYNIFLDAAGTQIWGDANAGTYSYDTYNATPQDKDFTDFMYGIMPNAQDLTPGSYSDVIFATLGASNNAGGPYNDLPQQTVTVSATVLPECRVDTFSLVFGTYSPFAATSAPSSTTVKVYCTKTTSATVSLDNGMNVSGGQRRMAGPLGSFLAYNAALQFASGGPSTSSLAPLAGGFPVSGSIPIQQDVPIGSYLDSLQAIVNY